MKTQDELSLGINFGGQASSHAINTHTLMDSMVRAFEKNRFGIMAAFMVFQVCLASVAIYYIFQNNAPIWQLIITAVTASASNAMCIAQASSKLCLITFYTSIFANGLLILINL